MATIDANGISIRTLLEIKDSLVAGYTDIDSGWDLRPESPDGQKVAIDAELLANVEEALNAAYNAVDPRSAVGQQLDNIADIIFLQRRDATPSTATVQFTGAAGTTVPANTTIRNAETDSLWDTDEEVTLDGNGEATVNMTAQEAGPLSAGIGDLSIIVDSVTGLQSVTNADAAAQGREEESDADFRIRRMESVARLGQNQVDSLTAELANLQDVTRVRIYENVEDEPDNNGLGPHSLMIIVQGGDNGEIMEIIANDKNPGTNINANNSGLTQNRVVEKTFTEGGNPVTVAFYRPVLVTIHVSVTIDGDYDETAVKQALIDYASGQLLTGGSGFRRTGFGIGEDVSLTRLYTPVNNVIDQDAEVTDLQIGLSSGSLGNSPIDIDFNELSVFDASTIEVNSA